MAARREEARADPQTELAENIARRMVAKAAYQGVLDQRNSALVTVAERHGERSKPYIHIRQRLEKDEAQLERIKVVVRRPVSRMTVRPWMLLVVGIVLALLEAPANKFLFDVALQSTGLASFGASAAVTAFLLILAHFAGRGIRQVWSDYRRRVIFSSLVTFIVCIAVATFMVGVLTVARAAFADESASIADIVKGVSGSVTDQGPLNAIGQALTNTSALVLACINIGGIVVTLLLAFFSHDSDRDYDHAQAHVAEGEKALAKMHARYLNAREKLVRQFAPDLLGYVGNYNAANQRVIELKTRLDRPLDEDDRFILTDLDKFSDALQRERPSVFQNDLLAPTPATPAPTTAAVPEAGPRREPTVREMSAYRRPTGTEEP
jgi:succinate dehydrogenase hydrophobic anchor subunit